MGLFELAPNRVGGLIGCSVPKTASQAAGGGCANGHGWKDEEPRVES